MPKRRSKFLPGYGRKVREFEFDLPDYTEKHRCYMRMQSFSANQKRDIFHVHN